MAALVESKLEAAKNYVEQVCHMYVYVWGCVGGEGPLLVRMCVRACLSLIA